MRRLFCIASAFIFLLCSGAVADGHLCADCSFTGSLEGRYIYFDLYEQDGHTICVSSLFPEIAAIPDMNDGSSCFTDYSAFACIHPETFVRIVQISEAFIAECFNSRRCQSSYGLFSGSLFEYASSMKSCSFSLREFSFCLQDYIQKMISLKEQHDQDMVVCYMLARFADLIHRIDNESDYMIYANNYDDGKYLTFQLTHHDEIMMSISLDISAENEKKLLISYRENGRYCFINLAITAEDRNTVLNSSFITSATSVMQPGMAPLFRESFIIDEESDSFISFQYIFEAESLKKKLYITGKTNTADAASPGINASVHIEGNENEQMNISLYTEAMNRSISFSDKRILHLNKPTERTEFQLAVSSGIMSLAAGIYPALPDDYQRILTALLCQ